MDSLAGYGSEDEYETENIKNHTGQPAQQVRVGETSLEQPPRYDDGTNYDDVTMDMSEDSSASESDGCEEDDESAQQEAERSDRSSSRSSDTHSNSRYWEDRINSREGARGAPHREEHDRNKKNSPPLVKRGLLGDRPGDPNVVLSLWNSQNCGSAKSSKTEDRKAYSKQPVPLMDIKTYGDQHLGLESQNDQSNRCDRESGDKKDKDNGDRSDRKHNTSSRHSDSRDRSDRYGDDNSRYHHDNKRHHRRRSRSRSRDRDRGFRRRSHSRDRDRRGHYRGDSRRSSDSPDRRPRRSHSGSPACGDYRDRASYKVSKKLHAMEKMGLQIKTPDGTMTTAHMLMQKSLDEQVEKVKNNTGIELPKYYNPAAMNPLKYAEQVQKKKLLWGNKGKESESTSTSSVDTNKPNPMNKWQGAKFAQDSDGKVASKFLRLMGVKDPNTVAAPQQTPGDIVKKQEEMFEAMQAQYDVARATTHTMRGVGLGFANTHRHF